MHFTLVYS